MPPRLAPVGKSSSTSSKRSDAAGPGAEGGAAREAVAVGEIVGAHALRGLLRVRAYRPPAPSLVPDRTVLVEHAGSRRRFRVTGATPHGRGLVLLALEGVNDRNTAEALIGGRVFVRLVDLPPPAPDEFYYHEVVGFRVETAAGEHLGSITETFATGANDVWVVRHADREHLIPVIADVVRRIDRPARRIVIEPLPGLLE